VITSSLQAYQNRLSFGIRQSFFLVYERFFGLLLEFLDHSSRSSLSTELSASTLAFPSPLLFGASLAFSPRSRV
jgi:hypothetical protein